MSKFLELPYLEVIRKFKSLFSQALRHSPHATKENETLRSDLSSDMGSISNDTDQSEVIKAVLVDFFGKFGYAYDTVPYDWDLDNSCYEECIKMGYPCDRSPPKGIKTVYQYLPGGVILATTSYAHLNRELQTFIAIFTALFFHIDDEYIEDTTQVETFGRCLTLGLPQQHTLLDALADFLKRTYVNYHGPTADIIMTSGINNVTAMVVENRMNGVELPPESRRFSMFLKMLSGIAEAYAMFVFPPEVPIEEYIQILPELVTFINASCDVLSLHKEELAGETINFISTQAKLLQKPKIQVFKDLCNDVFECHERILIGLEGKDPKLTSWYNQFAKGCFYFHTSFDLRYRLSDLFPLKPNAGLFSKNK